MNYLEFEAWISANCPSGVDEPDFIFLLASFTACQLQMASENSGRSIEYLVNAMFTGAPIEH